MIDDIEEIKDEIDQVGDQTSSNVKVQVWPGEYIIVYEPSATVRRFLLKAASKRRFTVIIVVHPSRQQAAGTVYADLSRSLANYDAPRSMSSAAFQKLDSLAHERGFRYLAPFTCGKVAGQCNLATFAPDEVLEVGYPVHQGVHVRLVRDLAEDQTVLVRRPRRGDEDVGVHLEDVEGQLKGMPRRLKAGRAAAR